MAVGEEKVVEIVLVISLLLVEQWCQLCCHILGYDWSTCFDIFLNASRKMNSDKFELGSGGLEIVRKSINNKKQCIYYVWWREEKEKLLRVRCSSAFINDPWEKVNKAWLFHRLFCSDGLRMPFRVQIQHREEWMGLETRRENEA